MAVQTRVRFLADDIWDCPDDGRRWEVIEGELHVTAAPDLDHQRPCMTLSAYIWPYLKQHDLGSIFASPVGLILDGENGLQPDMVYVARPRAAILTQRGIRGTPDMVVEVLSPGTQDKDRGVKMRRYATSGVAHYWIVVPATRTLEAYVLEEGAYRQTGTCTVGETFRPDLFPGLEIPIADLWL